MRTKILALVALALIALVVTTHATVTGAYKATVAPGELYEVSFTPTAPGPIRVHFEVRPLELWASAQLYKPNRDQPVAFTIGHSSFDLLAEVDPESRNQPWRVVLFHTNSVALTVELDITFPKAFCVEIASELSIRISYEEEAGELEDYHCDQMWRALRSLGVNLTEGLHQIKFLPPSDKFEGRFLSAGRIIEMYRMTPGRRFTGIFYHELAHFIHIIKLGASLKREWASLHRQSGADMVNYVREPFGGPPTYAMTNEYEDFAVTFSAYILNTKELFELGIARRDNVGKPILLEKAKLMAQVFLHYRDGKPYTYIYRFGFGYPVIPIERAGVLLKPEGLPDFTEPIPWERF
ncbi:MAG: hypothetical protein NZ930_01130 [Candidatus Bipolaricaulota bacterium]|nr:hypothetical protein [Candidatus Bipolaricaulota bacterium]MDW8031305.1 hypothetical protein [Candidatus Bipolaricaulota bacterium]